MKIADYTVHRLHFPLLRPIGDSQVRIEDHWMVVLKLKADTGQTGVGFELQQGIMIDANKAWSPKEALYRAAIYEREGFEIFWIEDPIAHEDYDGYARLCAEIPWTRINTGEYLGFSGKRRLLERSAVDVLNVHGAIAATRAATHLAGDYGVPVALGNTILEIGVHLAASLPECLYLEFSDLVWSAHLPTISNDTRG